MNMVGGVASAACVAIAAVAAVEATAQQYPSKPVRLIMPYPAGGSTDTVGRLIAEPLAVRLGEPVVIDNRPGASAQIGTEAVARSAADGYTLLMATSTNAINHALNPKLPYDFASDFTAIALVAKAAQVLVVHPSTRARTVKELIALAKSRPGELAYSSSGTGTSGHLAMEGFTREANIALIHVPYKGNAPALNDLLGGQVAAGFVNIVSVMPHVRSGRLVALGVSTAKRSALAPEIPTIAELGFDGFDIAAWFGIMAPAGTLASVVTRLSQEIARILDDPQIQKRLLAMGVDRAAPGTPQEFAEFIRTDIHRWNKLLRAIGLAGSH